MRRTGGEDRRGETPSAGGECLNRHESGGNWRSVGGSEVRPYDLAGRCR